MAKSNGILPSLSFIVESAFLSINSLTSSTFPPSQAPCKLVIPEFVAALIVAPFSNKAAAASLCPPIAAQCSGVRPLLSAYNVL